MDNIYQHHSCTWVWKTKFIFFTLIIITMAYSDLEEHPLSMDPMHETQSNHPNADEIFEAPPPPWRTSHLAAKSSNIQDWPLENILSTLYKQNIQIPLHANHEELFQLFSFSSSLLFSGFKDYSKFQRSLHTAPSERKATSKKSTHHLNISQCKFLNNQESSLLPLAHSLGTTIKFSLPYHPFKVHYPTWMQGFMRWKISDIRQLFFHPF